MTQCQGDVDEHNSIADYYGADVTVALSVYLIFDTPLGVEGYGEVGVFVAFHELDESETCNTHTQKKKSVNTGRDTNNSELRWILQTQLTLSPRQELFQAWRCRSGSC